MTFGNFMLEAVIISFSGVMAPGPLMAATVGKGSESPHAGAMIGLGHGIVEFPLMTALFFGFGYAMGLPYVKSGIGILGGFFLLFMAWGMIKDFRSANVESGVYTRSSLAYGMMLSAGNPYFLIWWATVGATLIVRASEFGALALAVFMVVHWLCDFIWLYFLSALSFKGGHFFGNTFQKGIFLVCGVFLFLFGGKFIWEAVRGIFYM